MTENVCCRSIGVVGQFARDFFDTKNKFSCTCSGVFSDVFARRTVRRIFRFLRHIVAFFLSSVDGTYVESSQSTVGAIMGAKVALNTK